MIKKIITRNIIIVFTLITLLSGCSVETQHDVQYYLDHPQEMKEKVKLCRGNPGKYKDDPNCINALKADFKVKFLQNSAMPKIK